jgi:hypothetical protein
MVLKVDGGSMEPPSGQAPPLRRVVARSAHTLLYPSLLPSVNSGSKIFFLRVESLEGRFSFTLNRLLTEKKFPTPVDTLPLRV